MHLEDAARAGLGSVVQATWYGTAQTHIQYLHLLLSSWLHLDKICGVMAHTASITALPLYASNTRPCMHVAPCAHMCHGTRTWDMACVRQGAHVAVKAMALTSTTTLARADNACDSMTMHHPTAPLEESGVNDHYPMPAPCEVIGCHQSGCLQHRRWLVLLPDQARAQSAMVRAIACAHKMPGECGRQ